MDSAYRYWEKLNLQASTNVKNVLLDNRDVLLNKGAIIGFDTGSLKLLDLDTCFLQSNNLKSIIVWNLLCGGIPPS
ncbi:hypothetical protein BVX94_00400 [bacterium B17]|nr:hypothetical protein BVX94_00400 [bacterium B17]